MVSLKIFILIPSPISLHMPFQSIRLFILHISSACMPVWSYVPSVISLLCYMPVQSHVFLYICLFCPHACSVICLSCTYVSSVTCPPAHMSLSFTCLFSHMSFLYICLFRPHASSATCLLSHMSLQPTCLVQNILALDRRRQLAYENPLTPF